jgi:hypothetical protein
MTRGGTVLIIVAGISALLASLTVAFLARMRSSVEETAVYEAEVQARLMLVAACSYVCETARIGYDTTSGPDHLEAFGWIDVRDGSEGPNTRGSTPTGATTIVPLWRPDLVERSRPGSPDRPAWPAKGGVARCPMYTMVRPPYAVELTSVYNPIGTDGGSAEFGQPLLKHKDPQPLMKTAAGFQGKDATPRRESMDRSWFRVYRDGPATFVITVGGGGTHGWRDYGEALAAGPQYTAEFNDDPQLFALLRAQEVCMWYRIEWSPAVATSEVHNIKNAWNQGPEDHFVSFPMNVSDSFRSQSHCRNLGGTIRWVQRLRNPPTRW